jgi:hypothetical protein
MPGLRELKHMTKKTTTAIKEGTRSANRPAGRATGSFEELLAAATPSSWDNQGGAPESAHARLDHILDQHRTFDDEHSPGGDVDDALLQLVDRASSWAAPTQRQASSPRRPTWIIHDPTDNWVVDRAGGNAIYLHYLPAWRSRALVSFVEYSHPLMANAVIEDLLEDNLFATVRPDIAHSLLDIALERRSRVSPAVLGACTQAIAATDLLGDRYFGLLINQKDYDERSTTVGAIFLSAAASFRWWSIAQQRVYASPSEGTPVTESSASGWRASRLPTPAQVRALIGRQVHRFADAVMEQLYTAMLPLDAALPPIEQTDLLTSPARSPSQPVQRPHRASG